MNDRHLDPPEIPELPEWTEALLEVLEDHAVPDDVSKSIHLAIDAHFEKENKAEAEALAQIHSEDFKVEDFEPHEVKCPHGKDFIDCDPCQHRADLEADAIREKGGRR